MRFSNLYIYLALVEQTPLADVLHTPFAGVLHTPFAGVLHTPPSLRDTPPNLGGELLPRGNFSGELLPRGNVSGELLTRWDHSGTECVETSPRACSSPSKLEGVPEGRGRVSIRDYIGKAFPLKARTYGY